MDRRFTIGKLAQATGVSAKTIRYYEQIGLLPSPERGESGYRLYSERDLRRLGLIRRARQLDMSLPEVRELVERASRGTCEDFQGRFLAMVRGKLADRYVVKLTAYHRKESALKVFARPAAGPLLERLRLDLWHLEADLSDASNELNSDCTMLDCSPETCACLGVRLEAKLATGGETMVEHTKTEDSKPTKYRDCGCGCGCGDTADQADPKDLLLVGSIADQRGSSSDVQPCDCGCEECP